MLAKCIMASLNAHKWNKKTHQLDNSNPDWYQSVIISFSICDRMRTIVFVVSICCAFLTGCQSTLYKPSEWHVCSLLWFACPTTYKKPPINEPSTDATIQLAEAAASVSDSMHDMAVVEKVMMPSNKDNTRTIPNIATLQKHVAIDWSGPIEELVARIAKTVGYHFHTVGKHPPMPVLISLTVKNETLVNVLRNIDYQAGNKASIRVYPTHHLIELRYAKIYS